MNPVSYRAFEPTTKQGARTDLKTLRLLRANADLRTENAGRKRVEEELRWKTAFLEAQVNSTIDGILVIDQNGKKILQNQKATDLLGIPAPISDERDDESQVIWVASQVKHPEQFLEKVVYLYSHPHETSQDEVEMKNGTILDRWSSPVIGRDGHHYGRIWTFRDITARVRAEEALVASRSKLESIINSVDGIVWEAEPETFRFTFVSDNAEQLLGYPVAQWMAEADFWVNHLHEEDKAWAPDYCTQAVSEMRAHEFEYRMIGADGRVVWVNDIVTVICEDGRATRLRGLIVDVTRAKQAEATLQESQARLELAMSASNIGPWDWNLLTNEVHFSPEWKRQLGYEEHEITGRASEFVSRLHPDEHVRIIGAMKAYRANPELGYDVEFRLRHKDGSYRWLHTRATLLFDPGGRPFRMLGCHVDITARKLAEEELAVTHKQLLVISREAGMAEVATSVLHNVGNVLNSVSVSAEVVSGKVRGFRLGGLKNVASLLRDNAANLSEFLTVDPRGKELPGYLMKLADNLAEPQRGILEELESLRKNIEHIKEIVATQQNYGRRSGILDTMSIIEVIEDAVRLNNSGLLRHEVHLTREYSEVPPFVTDRHLVLQILVNLLSNAKYAMDDTDTDKRLVVRAGMVTPETVRISVIDNGAGISPENLTRIFQHGFTTKKDGHGFGLHSGALAARELGGRLTAHSEGPGLGATFSLELPVNMKTR